MEAQTQNSLAVALSRQDAGSENDQYLTFVLGDELFAINALSVKEIIAYGNITKVPTINEFIEGVTNVRGNVMPIASLANMFGILKKGITNKTCIIIVSATFDGDKHNIGLIVDKVDKVHKILPQDMEDVPSFGTKIKRNYIYKVGKVGGNFITILNNYSILDIDVLSKVKPLKAYRGKSND